MEDKRITEILEEAKRVATTSYEEAYAFLLEEMEGIPWLICKTETDSRKSLLNNLIEEEEKEFNSSEGEIKKIMHKIQIVNFKIKLKELQL